MNLCTHRSDDSIRITAIRILLPTLASLWLVACSGGSGEGSSGSGGDSSGPDGGGAVGQSLTVTITAPESGTTWPAADMVQFAGEAEDPEDGPLAGNALVWKSDRDGVSSHIAAACRAASNPSDNSPARASCAMAGVDVVTS